MAIEFIGRPVGKTGPIDDICDNATDFLQLANRADLAGVSPISVVHSIAFSSNGRPVRAGPSDARLDTEGFCLDWLLSLMPVI